MEFVESLSLLHLQMCLSKSQPIECYRISQKSNNSRNHKEIQAHNNAGNFGKFSIGNSSHYMLSSSSMAAYSSPLKGEDPSWDLVTEQTIGLEATNSVTVTESIFNELPLRLPTWGIVILIIGYLLVFIFGLVGNCCVLVVVTRLRRMQTVTNYFIASLATADLLVLLFCLLPNLVSNIFVRK